MAKFTIARSYGYAGDTETLEVEAESREEAENMAWEWACERVDSWVEEEE